MLNRFLDKCPICRVGRNDKQYGGNKTCFHCGTCGFTECEVFSPMSNPIKEYIQIIEKRLLKFREVKSKEEKYNE